MRRTAPGSIVPTATTATTLAGNFSFGHAFLYHLLQLLNCLPWPVMLRKIFRNILYRFSEGRVFKDLQEPRLLCWPRRGCRYQGLSQRQTT